eukprot:8133272-Karenia_brevis.AAC.1
MSHEHCPSNGLGESRFLVDKKYNVTAGKEKAKYTFFTNHFGDLWISAIHLDSGHVTQPPKLLENIDIIERSLFKALSHDFCLILEANATASNRC